MKKKLIIFLLSLFFSFSAFSVKFEATTGVYNFSAKTSRGSGSIGGAGFHRISYLLPVLRNLEAGIGYTFMASQIITGDLGFGFDLSLKYFPFSGVEPDSFSTGNSVALFNPKFRPYVGLGFYQRQFQSVGTAYGGVGIKGGTEMAYSSRVSLVGDFRYISYAGPQSSTATEISLSFGLTIHFK